MNNNVYSVLVFEDHYGQYAHSSTVFKQKKDAKAYFKKVCDENFCLGLAKEEPDAELRQKKDWYFLSVDCCIFMASIEESIVQ